MGKYYWFRRSIGIIFLLFTFCLSGCSFPAISLGKAPPPSILVAITDPDNNEKFPVSGALSIRSEVVADDPIQKLELWADGILVEEYPVENRISRYLAHTWTWESGSLGKHSITVRTFTIEEDSAQSNVLNLVSIKDPGADALYVIQSFDTLDGIAKKYSTTLSQIMQANPQLNLTDPIPVGESIKIPLGAEITSILNPPPKQVANTNQPGLISFVNFPIQKNPLRLFAGSSGSPVIGTGVDGCSVSLFLETPASIATGYNIYRLNQGGLTFVKIASIPSGNTSNPAFLDQGLAKGQYQYYFAAYSSGLFAASSENPSNIVAPIVIDSKCAGDILSVESLLPDGKGLSQVYLYLNFNGKGWIRFPQNQFVFMDSTLPINIAEMALMIDPGLSGNVEVDGEGWGWRDGELVFLGGFKKSILASPTLASNSPSTLTQFYSTKLEVRGAPILDTKNYLWGIEKTIVKYDSYPFRWGTNTNADGGVWQVSSQPFPATPSLNPACLLLTDSIPAGTLQIPAQFKIDFTPLAPKPLSVSSSPKDVQNDQFVIPSFPPASPPYSPQTVFKDNEPPQFVQIPISFNPCTLSTTVNGITTYYVRVLPTNNEQLLPTPSNTTVVKYDPVSKEIKVEIKTAPNVTFYDVKIVEFNEIHVPDGAYTNCVKVKKNPFYPSISPVWGNAPPGSVVCPKPYQGAGSSALEDIGNFIKDAINYISKVYDELSDFVTELAAKLNPFCIQAEFVATAVGSGSEEVDKVCYMVASIAVTAAKMYVGIPPSLPNFEQLKTMGKDYLVELAADELEANNIPCPDECKKLIAKGVDYSLDQVSNSFKSPACVGEAEAHNNGFEPLCPPKGVEVEPDPKGQPAPPTVVIEVTRRLLTTAPNIPQPTSCYATISGTVTNNSYAGESHSFSFGQANFNWQGTELKGGLLAGGAPIPSLALGQSVKIPLKLDPTDYWLPGHYKWYKQWVNVPPYDDWNILYQGAALKLETSGTCLFTGYSSTNFPYVVGEEKSYGPLGEAYKQPCYPNCP